MPNILSLLYRGEYAPQGNPYHPDQRYAERVSVLGHMEDRLLAGMQGEMREEFSKYLMLRGQTGTMEEEAAFMEGVRLGIRLMASVWKADE